jgi:cysteinyl-tRNA synthetase
MQEVAEANALRAVLLDEYWREANEARNEALRVLEAARKNFEAARAMREKWEQAYRDLQGDLSELHEYRRFFSHPLERDLVLGKAILPR